MKQLFRSFLNWIQGRQNQPESKQQDQAEGKQQDQDESSQETENSQEKDFEDVVLSYHLLMKSNGDVFLETECYNFDSSLIHIIGTLFFLINSGQLAELNIQSVKTWIDDNPDQVEFVQQILIVWQMLEENRTADKQDLEQPVVHPLRALEPDGK